MTQLDDRIYALARRLTSHSAILKIVTVAAFVCLYMSARAVRFVPAKAAFALPFALIVAAGLIGLTIDGSRSKS